MNIVDFYRQELGPRSALNTCYINIKGETQVCDIELDSQTNKLNITYGNPVNLIRVDLDDIEQISDKIFRVEMYPSSNTFSLVIPGNKFVL